MELSSNYLKGDRCSLPGSPQIQQMNSILSKIQPCHKHQQGNISRLLALTSHYTFQMFYVGNSGIRSANNITGTQKPSQPWASEYFFFDNFFMCKSLFFIFSFMMYKKKYINNFLCYI